MHCCPNCFPEGWALPVSEWKKEEALRLAMEELMRPETQEKIRQFMGEYDLEAPLD